ncbi:interleukin-1 receptor-like 1 [Anabas testudineus]|uniref:Interleukin 18 receptor 1 n=1 Tax=Anabas testudineus TaxID=64144 RepID=A0A3Q1IU61_ANATE|nr:interleukin-1 receptor-like 1 [Anabas testudineus]
MMEKAFVLLLLLLHTSSTGVCSSEPEEINIKAGEMVALQCPYQSHSGDTRWVWTAYTPQEMALTSDTSCAKQGQMDVLVHGRSLVFLRASVKHQGNYSCSLGNASSQFRLTVYNTENKEKFSKICTAEESCTLSCPEVNIPDVNTLNMTSNPITWRKEGESLPNNGYFQSVGKEDKGVYICTRSYLYCGEKYNMTFTMVLDVKPKEPRKTEAITSPYNNDVFRVDLGSVVVIDCKAVAYSNFTEVFWLRDTSFVETNDSFPVFYNSTEEKKMDERKITASLVIKKVSEEDLSSKFTCKLESDSQMSVIVTITLAQKARPSYVSLVAAIVSIVVVMTVTVVIYVKFKIDLTLFLRDTLGCHRSPSDGKSYDAFLLCYDSDTDAGLKDCDRKWLESVLESSYGYSLCLYDRDILPGRAEAQAVLDCIENSRAVVLVPTPPDSGPGSALLSAIHAALVEHQSHLVFIKTEESQVPSSGSVGEALQLLGEAGDYVTWKGSSSLTSSSSFLKQLRYYLPAPQHPPKHRLLLQTAQDVTSGLNV